MKKSYLIIPLITLIIAYSGSWLTNKGMDWYKTIKLPDFTPSGSIIGFVWTIIFILAAISALIVWNRREEIASSPLAPRNDKLDFRFRGNDKGDSIGRPSASLQNDKRDSIASLSAVARSRMTKRKKWIIAVFLINGFLNIFWSYLFFYNHSIGLAVLEAGLLGLSVLILIILIKPINRLSSVLLYPYLIWVIFASYLTYVVWSLNR